MKAPFKVLYSNDLTHIESCVSPYHKQGEPFSKEMLEASVDETAGTGVDVHMLQPGFGWVPMWQSKILPFSTHWKWLRDNYAPMEPDAYSQYLLDGGDIVADFTRRCREKKLIPFVSFRMNDTHHLDKVNSKCGARFNVCKFYREHPEYILETASNSWRDRGQNWAIPEVREYKFNFIRELCENYDLDGIELDFMRYPALFRPYETTSAQRKEIIEAFVGRVRGMLDKTAADRHRWLSVKLPAIHKAHDGLGMDIARLASAGVDMFNLSYYTYTAQNGDLALIRQQTQDAAMYVQMTHCTSQSRTVEKADGDTSEVLKTSDEQFYTTADAAFKAGLDGVSLFNFVYYRKHGSIAKKDEVKEPPFGIIKNLREPKSLPNQEAHYFIGTHDHDDSALPKCMISLGQYASLSFPSVSLCGKTANAVLKAHVFSDREEAGDWEAWFNDRPVFNAPNSTSAAIRECAKTLTWNIPVEIIREGENHVDFRSKDTTLSIIDFLELVIWEDGK